MYDKPLALEILRQIEWSAKTIQKRFQPVKSVADLRYLMLVWKN